MRLAALVSDGKDSLYATYLASREHKVCVLVTIKSLNLESYMYHVPNIDLVKLQARAMRLSLIFRHSTGGERGGAHKTSRLEAKEEYGVEGVVSRAIFSNYRKKRIDRICDSLG